MTVDAELTGYQGQPVAHPGAQPGARPWRRLGAFDVRAGDAAPQVRALLRTALPGDVTSPVLRRDMEQAVVEAIARRQRHDAPPPRVILISPDVDAASREQCDCWSFFVIERPAAQADLRETIEVCLYHE